MYLEERRKRKRRRKRRKRRIQRRKRKKMRLRRKRRNRNSWRRKKTRREELEGAIDRNRDNLALVNRREDEKGPSIITQRCTCTCPSVLPSFLLHHYSALYVYVYMSVLPSYSIITLRCTCAFTSPSLPSHSIITLRCILGCGEITRESLIVTADVFFNGLYI